MSAKPQHLGKYELLQCLGYGGMAEVWKAFDPQLRRYVAIKFLHANLRTDPDFMTRFIREAQVIASLRHPNIVQIHDFQVTPPNTDNPMAYMVMDYIEGQTLAGYIRQLRNSTPVGTLPPSEDIVRLFTSICVAVDYAHQHGMIHRDIKPSNILLDKHNTTRNPMGEPILSDFGIVKMMGTAPGTLTSSGTGTPAYISPEQARGLPGNECSDIYSLGVILYEIYTGTLPFQGENPRAIMVQHLLEAPTPPRLINPNIPPALEVVILRCMEKEPSARFTRAASLAAALAEALHVPIPDEVRHLKYPSDPSDKPTYYNPTSTDPLSALMPEENPSSPQPVRGAAPYSRAQATPAAMVGNQQLSPNATQPEPLSAAAISPQARISSPPISWTPPVAYQPAQPVPSAPPKPLRRLNKLYVVLSTLLLFVLLAVGLALFLHPLAPVAGQPAQIVGHAYFTNSGISGPVAQSQGPSGGLSDEFQITLNNVPAPQQGKSYYGWLLSDKGPTETKTTSLGTLAFNNGTATLPQPYIDPQHNNLIAFTSRVLVTLDDANNPPLNPLLDTTKWVYYAELPQATASDGTSGLTHLRHLLSTEPTLERARLKGGVAIWLLQDTEMIQRWSTEALDNAILGHRRAKIINALYYLEGPCAKQDLSHVPAGVINAPDPGFEKTQIPLLECPLTPGHEHGHIQHTLLHLTGLIQSPGATAYQKNLAAQINEEMKVVNARMGKVLADVKKLVNMTDQQFANAPELEDVSFQIRDALSGQLDPATHTMRPGVAVIYEQLQSLATFDLQPYHQTP